MLKLVTVNVGLLGSITSADMARMNSSGSWRATQHIDIGGGSMMENDVRRRNDQHLGGYATFFRRGP